MTPASFVNQDNSPLMAPHFYPPQLERCRYNVRIKWENGEIKSDLLGAVAAESYAKEINLLNTKGWKSYKLIARPQTKCILEQINQTFQIFHIMNVIGKIQSMAKFMKRSQLIYLSH